MWMFVTHRESLMHVEFLYRACRRGSQDRRLSQEVAIVTPFYGPLLAPWPFCDFQARSRVTPGVWCHSSNPANPSLSSSSPSPNHSSSFPSIPCLGADSLGIRLKTSQSSQVISSLSPPTSYPLPRSLSLTCVDFMCLAPSCHCLFWAHKFISPSAITFLRVLTYTSLPD